MPNTPRVETTETDLNHGTAVISESVLHTHFHDLTELAGRRMRKLMIAAPGDERGNRSFSSDEVDRFFDQAVREVIGSPEDLARLLGMDFLLAKKKDLGAVPAPSEAEDWSET